MIVLGIQTGKVSKDSRIKFKKTLMKSDLAVIKEDSIVLTKRCGIKVTAMMNINTMGDFVRIPFYVNAAEPYTVGYATSGDIDSTSVFCALVNGNVELFLAPSSDINVFGGQIIVEEVM